MVKNDINLKDEIVAYADLGLNKFKFVVNNKLVAYGNIQSVQCEDGISEIHLTDGTKIVTDKQVQIKSSKELNLFERFLTKLKFL